jgi:hypothetical protein
MTWLEEVKTWVGEVVGPRNGQPIVPYRTTPHEVVLRFSTSCGNVYFKGLSSDRAREVQTTSALAELMPDSFARTLRLEMRPDGVAWWLTEECPGIALAHVANARNWRSCERARQVVVACAQVQCRVNERFGGGASLGISTLDLSMPAEWGKALIEHDADLEDADLYCAALQQACQAASVAEVPQSWIPLDLDPSNVLLDDDGVRFIDLDDSYIGPAPLALSTFQRRLVRHLGGLCDGERSNDALRVAYEQAWSPSLPMGDSWRAFEIVSTLIEGYLGWTLLVKNTERGVVHGALDLGRARAARRLVRALGHCRR